nr:cohesin domain-containing protein [Candidatus Njordarchaeum guaymaensis]
MKKLSNSLPLLLILMLSITTMASLSPVYASPTDLSVLFPNGTTESINEYFTGDMFAVDIYVADVTDLFGFEFKLKYDPSVLTAVDVIIGDFLQPDY